jgi:hypothetical protein
VPLSVRRRGDCPPREHPPLQLQQQQQQMQQQQQWQPKAAPSAPAFSAVLAHLTRVLEGEWVLVLDVATSLHTDALCALLSAAAHSASHAQTVESVAYVPATRLSSPRTGVRAVGHHHGTSALALPLGGPLSAGALRNTYGSLALLRVSALRRVWRREAGEGSPLARSERCGAFVWQLLSRAALAGTSIEPVPLVLSDAHAPSTSHTTPRWRCPSRSTSTTADGTTADGATSASSPCAEMTSLRHLLRQRASSPPEVLRGVGRANDTTSSSHDALDLSGVLEVLQRLTSLHEVR